MANRLRTLLFIAAVAYIPGGMTAYAQSAFQHPGRVVSGETREPLEAAVKAWSGSQLVGREGDCSLFGDSPLDSQVSDKSSGKFVLTIDQSHSTYTVTYCKSNYVPRDDRDQPNRPDGASIIPTPVDLWPVEQSEEQKVTYSETVTRQIVGFLNELAYLKRVNGERFSSAVDTLAKDISQGAPDRANLLYELVRIVDSWAEE